ncbi:MAG: mechanosensitive ion channel family protein [Rickettsiales bacterium]
MSYLVQLVQWQRDAAVIDTADQSARELIFQDSVRQNGMRAVKAGFAFARAQASIAPADIPEKSETGTEQQRLSLYGQQTQQAVTNARALLKTKLGSAQRAQAEGRLKLALAEQELYETLQANFNAAASGGGIGFTAKIGNLQRGIPELLGDNAPAAAPSKPTADDTPRPSASTVLSLSGELFSIAQKQRELNALIVHTSEIQAAGSAMLKELRTTMDSIILAPGTGSQMADARVADFKDIASVVAPLAETNVWVSSSKNALKDWNQSLSERFSKTLKQFGIRLAILLITLAIPLVMGEIAERMIDHYVTDPKRQRQSQTARRILVVIAVIFVFMFNFISDFSSFITFAGFMTAGIAVALQGVLLSLVAHFFFYGRFGVRAGDRVNVAGVTGDIVQIGMIRFYVRELATNAEGVMEPTGKMVAFPNSILFQPSGFYKYV